jgi:cob(I)alamin adenosyltransferase
VCWISFFKDPAAGRGETAALKKLGADVFILVAGHPLMKEHKEKANYREDCLGALVYVKKKLKKNYDLVVLDEINIALRDGFLKENELLALLEKKPEHTEVVLTGDGATPGLVKAASLVTEMKKIKHPFDKGIKARPGIEY